jgi:hypothetical protein
VYRVFCDSISSPCPALPENSTAAHDNLSRRLIEITWRSRFARYKLRIIAWGSS